MKRTGEQAASVEQEPRAPREGEALVREPEECKLKSLCIEHSRGHKEYYMRETLMKARRRREGWTSGSGAGRTH